ncbi:Concanavalin A-like lectin/glucanases superfamily protein [Acidaminococcus fermentans]|uniref:putative phage tail protein n=1 Tax=Acidaminococcus fermentans TaxID=905 RepID=UPI0008E678DD|nr:putative phage tail protein [Acidaminococcus fermentans]SFO70481.1 Concanavalin A-like lectin/glucanases superfamily protein [Acidaminococcus fermentans]
MPNFRLLRDSDPDVSKYLPLFLINDPTFKSWLDTQSEEHKRLWMDIVDAWKQFYVEEATWGLSDWEKFLGIPTDEKLSYTVRRSAIIAKMNGTQTVTKEFLERTINSFTSDKSSRVVDHPDQYSVDIYLPNGGVLSFEEMDKAIRTFMPAHIGWRYIYQTYVNGSQYIGAVLRPARTIMEMGRLKGDKLTGQSVLRLDKAIDYVNDDGQIQTTPDGVKTNAVLDATPTTISPCSSAPIGATDGIFYVSGDGSVKQKVGAPATFTRASTAVLGGRTYQVNEPRFMDNMLLLVQDEDGKAKEQLTIAEWVVNKREWTFESEIKFVRGFKNWEWTPFFAYSDYDAASNGYSNAFRLEIRGRKEGIFKGDGVNDLSLKLYELNTVYKLAVTWSEGIINIYIDGKHTSTDYAIRKDPRPKTLSSIMLGWGGPNGFIGCVGDIRFSSTVHTAEKIAADSKVDALPVEEDTVLYMPLKEDLSMYGHYND